MIIKYVDLFHFQSCHLFGGCFNVRQMLLIMFNTCLSASNFDKIFFKNNLLLLSWVRHENPESDKLRRANHTNSRVDFAMISVSILR